MEFHNKPNIISVPESYWIDYLRPALLKGKYSPQGDDEDINDFIFNDGGNIILPKFFWHALYHTLKVKLPEVDRYVQLPQIMPETRIDVELKDGVQLREYQVEVIDKLLHMYKENLHIRTILRATTGFGKTMVATYLISQLKLKPIIICHNQTLYDQWQEALLTFLNITEDDIGKIQGSSIKKIKKELEKKIIIVKAQSLLSQVKRLPLDELYDLYSDISMIIFDEAHTTSGAIKFAKVAAIFRTPNILGLSATPFRTGIHQLILDSNINPEVLSSSHINLTPEVIVKKVDTGNINPDVIKRLRFMSQYVQKLAIVSKILTSNIQYLNLIVEDIIKREAEGRHILVIAANNTMVKKIVTLLEAKKISASEFTAQQREFGDARVIVSNNQMASTGFSLDSLDTLFLVNNNIGRSLLVQSAGRILRIKENKKKPIITIYFDNLFLSTVNESAPWIVQNNLKTEYGDSLKFKIIDYIEEEKK
jgi:superfamily II DNA or RNA helicase